MFYHGYGMSTPPVYFESSDTYYAFRQKLAANSAQTSSSSRIIEIIKVSHDAISCALGFSKNSGV